MALIVDHILTALKGAFGMDDDTQKSGAVFYLLIALAVAGVVIGFVIGYIAQSHGWTLPAGW